MMLRNIRMSPGSGSGNALSALLNKVTLKPLVARFVGSDKVNEAIYSGRLSATAPGARGKRYGPPVLVVFSSAGEVATPIILPLDLACTSINGIYVPCDNG